MLFCWLHFSLRKMATISFNIVQFSPNKFKICGHNLSYRIYAVELQGISHLKYFDRSFFESICRSILCCKNKLFYINYFISNFHWSLDRRKGQDPRCILTSMISLPVNFFLHFAYFFFKRWFLLFFYNVTTMSFLSLS